MAKGHKVRLTSNIPESVLTSLLHAAGAWHIPVAAYSMEAGRKGTSSTVVLAPCVTAVRSCLREGGFSCRGFPKCFRAAAVTTAGESLGDDVYGVRCPRGKLVIVTPFMFTATRHGLAFGCLPAAFAKIRSDSALLSPLEIAQVTPPSACRNAAQRRRALTCFATMREQAYQVSLDHWHREQRSAADISNRRKSKRLQETMTQLLATPGDSSSLREALCRTAGVRAMCHMTVWCDGQGVVGLVPDSLLKWSPKAQSLQVSEGSQLREVELRGALRIVRQGANGGLDWDWYQAEELKENDPIRRIIRSIPVRATRGTWVAVSRAIRPLADGNCDRDQECRAKHSCPALWRTPRGGGIERRLVGVTIAVTGREALKDTTHRLLMQIASLLLQKETDVRELEEALLKGIPALSHADQKRFLGRLFVRCTSMKDPRMKGQAFEVFCAGLLRLVPGWIPAEPRRTNVARTAEIDIPVRVEPSEPAAQYWHDTFGTMIFVECKNYPSRLKATIDGNSPVKKLHVRLRDHGVRLGLVLCTGKIPDVLWAQAERTADTGHLVALFERDDLMALIKTPGDIERNFKAWVSEAQKKLRRPSRRDRHRR